MSSTSALFRSLLQAGLLTWATGSAQAFDATRVTGATPAAPTATCQVGELRPSDFMGYGLMDTGDIHYALLDPTTCTACAGGLLQIQQVHFRIGIGVAGCTMNLKVSLVDAAVVNGRYQPYPETVICPPVTLSQTFPAAGSFDLSAAPAQPCCISRPAFARIEVVSCSCNASAFNTGIGFVVGQYCVLRQSWFYDASVGTFHDTCDYDGFNVAIWADADCCDATGMHGTTWGRLKVRYH